MEPIYQLIFFLIATAVISLMLGYGIANICEYVYDKIKAARAKKRSDAVFHDSYEQRLVEHWRDLAAGLEPLAAAALLDELMADYRRRRDEGERIKAAARQGARVRLAEHLFVQPQHTSYTSEKPVWFTPEQMLKDNQEKQP